MSQDRINIKDMAVYSPMELLYSTYASERPAASSVLAQSFQNLDKYFSTLPPQELAATLDAFYDVYAENERLAFTAGVQVGVQLAKELA